MTGGVVLVSSIGCRGGEGKRVAKEIDEEEEEEVAEVEGQNLLAFLLEAFRRSMLSSCRLDRHGAVAPGGVLPQLEKMEIGWPTEVRHVSHVTFDRFHGFLGLPEEFELADRVPSASVSVFGVSAESMQCCYDSRGNSVPTILLLMQERLYSQGGLKAEGIFRINPENGQEENVREQLNQGKIPEDIDVHCLAGLIKAWFRELPAGVLDGLSPEQVLRCNMEEEFVELVKLLLPTQAALLDWAIELMADVVEEEEANKMNARNIAMVFAPNMTQMSDPLTALMHAVQVMNLLKALILKALREREESAINGYSVFSCSPSVDHRGGEDCNSQQDTDISYESRGTSSANEHDSYIQDGEHISGRHRNSLRYSTDDENDSLRDIEECFLRQLEWKADESKSEERISLCSSVQTQATLKAFETDSFISMTMSKQECMSTDDELDKEPSITKYTDVDKTDSFLSMTLSKLECMSTDDETDSEPNIAKYIDADMENRLKQKETDKKELADCKLISCV